MVNKSCVCDFYNLCQPIMSHNDGEFSNRKKLFWIPGKPTYETASYRSIALSSCLSKVLEKSLRI